jgi:hypothetical protein
MHAHAQVYRATWNEVQTVAVKQLLQHDARNDIRFLREIAILKECRSTHVVQFLVRARAPVLALTMRCLALSRRLPAVAGPLCWPQAHSSLGGSLRRIFEMQG